MTGILMFFAVLTSTILTLDFSRTILELRRQRIAIKAMRRQPGGFNV